MAKEAYGLKNDGFLWLKINQSLMDPTLPGRNKHYWKKFDSLDPDGIGYSWLHVLVRLKVDLLPARILQHFLHLVNIT